VSSRIAPRVPVVAPFATLWVRLATISRGARRANFLDARLVRMVLLPAVMQLLGKWHWWIPSLLERALPRIDVGRREPAPESS
jgi:RND superfamily putative drug exporter